MSHGADSASRSSKPSHRTIDPFSQVEETVVPTYIALLKFIRGVNAVLEETVPCVSLVPNEADIDIGICPTPT